MKLEGANLERVHFDLSFVQRPAFALDLDLKHFSHRIIHEEWQAKGFHERETSIVMSALLKEGDTVIDVGAHIGYFSFLAATLVGPAGQVFAFEPIGENLSYFRHNIEINAADNVKVIQKIVGDRVGFTPFYFNRDNDGGHALWDVGQHPFNVQSKADPLMVDLPITTLDDHFASTDLAALKMIKLDTEGNEFNVLKGARTILDKYRVRCIAWELNTFALTKMGHTEDQLRAYMRDLGYVTMAFVDENLRVLQPMQHIRSDFVSNLFFMPTEFVAAGDTF